MLTVIELIGVYLRESRAVIAHLERRAHDIELFVSIVLQAYASGQRVFVCANGGGVGYAANFAVDLNLHAFASEDKTAPSAARGSFEVVNLCADPAVLTALMNDRGPDQIFAAQVAESGEAGDVLVAFSGSGNSPNVVEALRQARRLGMLSVLCTRNAAARGSDVADVSIVTPCESEVPGQMTGPNGGNFHAEDAWSKLSHIACGALRERVTRAPA